MMSCEADSSIPVPGTWDSVLGAHEERVVSGQRRQREDGQKPLRLIRQISRRE